MDYFFFKETNKILMKVKTDTDSNKVFDPYDQCIYREVSLHEPKLGTVLFGEQMISDLKNCFEHSFGLPYREKFFLK